MGLAAVLKSLFIAPAYKSRGEEMIAQFLEEAGIPFWYEKELLLENGRYRERFLPDFTLKRRKYIEYWGMLDFDPAYEKRMRYKMAIYRRNQVDFLSIYGRNLYREQYKRKIEAFVK